MFNLKAINRKTTTSVEDAYQSGLSAPPPRKTKSLFKPLRLNNRTIDVQEPRYVAERRKLESFAALLASGLPMIEEALDKWAAVATVQARFSHLIANKADPCFTNEDKAWQDDEDDDYDEVFAGVKARDSGTDKKTRNTTNTTINNNTNTTNGKATRAVRLRMRARFEVAARHSAATERGFREELLHTSVVPNILTQLRRVRAHIERLRARHRDVGRAKTEFEACDRRYRHLQNRAAVNREALVRAKGRFERSRDLYNAMADRMVERMGDVNARMTEVVNTMHYLFWMLQHKAARRISDATGPDMADSSAAEPLLCYAAFGYGLRDPATMFHALVYRKDDK